MATPIEWFSLAGPQATPLTGALEGEVIEGSLPSEHIRRVDITRQGSTSQAPGITRAAASPVQHRHSIECVFVGRAWPSRRPPIERSTEPSPSGLARNPSQVRGELRSPGATLRPRTLPVAVSALRPTSLFGVYEILSRSFNFPSGVP
jgi:hypothetical protein